MLCKYKYCRVLTLIQSKPRVWSSHRQLFSSVSIHFAHHGTGKAEPKSCSLEDLGVGLSLWWEPRTLLSKAISSLDATPLWAQLKLSKGFCSLGRRDPPSFPLVENHSPEYSQGVTTRTWANTSTRMAVPRDSSPAQRFPGCGGKC